MRTGQSFTATPINCKRRAVCLPPITTRAWARRILAALGIQTIPKSLKTRVRPLQIAFAPEVQRPILQGFVRWGLTLLGLLCLLFVHQRTFADTHLEPTESTPPHILEPYISYHSDHSHQWGVDQAIDEYEAFIPLSQKPLLTSAQMHWYRVPLKNTTATQSQWIVSSGIASALTLNAFWVSEDIITPIALQKAISRYATHSNFAIPLDIPPHSQGHLYIQYDGIAQFPMDLQLLTPQDHVDRRFKYTLLNGIALGVIAVFLVFFFIQFLLYQRKDIGFYCLFIFSIQWFAVQVFGYGVRFYAPEQIKLDYQVTELAAGSIYLFYFLFTAHLFKHGRWMRFTLNALAAMIAVLSLAGLVFEMDLALTLVVAVGMPIAIVAASQSLKQQKVTAWLFIIGSVAHYLFTCLLLFMLLGAPLGAKVFAFSTAGQMVDILCFSTAILLSSRRTQSLLDQQISQRLTDLEHLNTSEKAVTQLREQNKHVILDSSRTAHDLQQVLSAIRLQLSAQPSTPTVEMLQHSVNYAADLLNQRIQKGKTDYGDISESHNLKSLIAAAAARHQLQLPNLRWRAHHCILPCSPVALQRLIDNLVNNASKYAGNGQILLTGRRRKNGYCIQVRDQGPGIAQHKLQQIFEPFERVSATDIEDLGHGLGLNIVKFLCDEFGYRFSVSSVAGKGSCFSIEILANLDTP